MQRQLEIWNNLLTSLSNRLINSFEKLAISGFAQIFINLFASEVNMIQNKHM